MKNRDQMRAFQGRIRDFANQAEDIKVDIAEMVDGEASVSLDRVVLSLSRLADVVSGISDAAVELAAEVRRLIPPDDWARAESMTEPEILALCVDDNGSDFSILLDEDDELDIEASIERVSTLHKILERGDLRSDTRQRVVDSIECISGFAGEDSLALPSDGSVEEKEKAYLRFPLLHLIRGYQSIACIPDDRLTPDEIRLRDEQITESKLSIIEFLRERWPNRDDWPELPFNVASAESGDLLFKGIESFTAIVVTDPLDDLLAT